MSTTDPIVSIRPLRRLLRVVLWLTLSFFILFGAVALSLRTQVVQTTVVQWLADKVSEKLGFECTIGGFYLDWVDKARITQVKIKDQQGKPMIEIGVLTVNVKLATLLERNINLDFVSLVHGIVSVRVDQKTNKRNINEFVKAIIRLTDDGDTTRSPNPSIFSIDKAELKQMAFAYMDEREAAQPGQFDYYHFKLIGLEGEIDNFWQHRDTIRLEAKGLHARDAATGLMIHELTTNFRFTDYDMLFGKLKARIGDSYLQDSLAFNYESIDDFSDFNQKVQLKANLDSSVVTSQDLSFFAPTLKDWFETYTVSGKFSGTVDNFTIKKMKVFTGTNSFFSGTLNMRGFPEVDETFMDLRLKSSFVNPKDMEFYAGKTASEFLLPFGIFDVSGSFTGFFDNFVTKNKVKTALGNFEADMQMKLEDDLQASTYNGKLKTEGFDLGRLVHQSKYLQKVSMNGTLSGRGFEFKKAKIKYDVEMDQLGVLGYNYQNIKSKGLLDGKHFSGDLKISDPHLVFTGKGDLDLIKNNEVVNIEANLAKINCKPLKLTQGNLDVSSEINLNFRGFDFDNFLGKSELKNFRVLYGDERMDLEEIKIESHLDGPKKTLTLISPLMDARLEGKFKYRQFVDDGLAMIKEYESLIKNKKNIGHLNERGSKKNKPLDYGINFTATLKNLNPVFDLLDYPVHLSNNTAVDAQVQFGKTELLIVNTHLDTLVLQDKKLIDTEIDITSTKTKDRPDVIAEVYLSGAKQLWQNDIATERVFFDGVWSDGKINFKSQGFQTGTTNNANIAGTVDFEPQTVRIKLQNSTLHLVEKTWRVNQENEIEISDTATVWLKNVAIANEYQRVAVQGYLTGSDTDTLTIDGVNFELATLKPLINQELTGTVNAHIFVSNLNQSPLFEGHVKADSVVYQNFWVGDFDGSAHWVRADKQLEINGTLARNNQDILKLSGSYKPSEDKPLNIKATANRLNINILQLILEGVASEIKGWASGSVLVQGTFKKPEITGSLFVKDGQVKVNYLNTTYFFNHEVAFNPTEISANGVVLMDEKGEQAKVRKASLRHQYFDNFYLQMEGELDHFMVFNTTILQNSLYYGSAVMSGTISMFGSFDDMTIRSKVRTESGTKLYIPLDANRNEDLGESYITFTQSEKTKRKIASDSVAKVKLTGIKMEFDLDVNEDAMGEIIFDQRTGDIIRARGVGKIKLLVDTRGEFSVIGQYVIKTGSYRFTTFNLVNKDFIIRSGSTITFNGPVLEGVMDILAEYRLNASLAPLASTDEKLQNSPESKRRYPVVVSMRLTQELLKPLITLGLEIKDYPKNSDLNYYVQAFQSRIASDEQELNRQVFSLMIFRMFAPEGQWTQASGISYSSFSDMVSNQLSTWLSQFDQNLQVDVDLSGLSQSALNNFQLRFSYTLLQGRLQLTRDGGFTNSLNQTSALSIAGDWKLEYMLSKDGVFRVKMFHRNNQNLVLSGLNTSNFTQGASVLHTQSFNRLSDLFPKRKKKPEPESKKEVKPEATLPPGKEETSQNR